MQNKVILDSFHPPVLPEDGWCKDWTYHQRKLDYGQFVLDAKHYTRLALQHLKAIHSFPSPDLTEAIVELEKFIAKYEGVRR